jgi:hypothetical protein
MSNRNSRFDLSNNVFTPNLDEFMYYYQRNIREYTENIHEYNTIINGFLTFQNNIHNIHNIHRVNNQYNNHNNNNNNREDDTSTNGFLGLGTLSNIRNPFQDSIPTNILPARVRNTPLFRNILQPHNQYDYEDVIVTPSVQQITIATETFPFIETEIEEVCPITREPINNGEEICRIRYCGHIFKTAALMSWFQRNVRCPVCRYDIRDYIYPRSQEQVSQIISEEEEETKEEETFNNMEIENEFDDIVRELIQEQTNIPVRNPLVSTLTNAIRSFVNQELQRIPVNATTTDLIYSFDLPLTLDISGNYRL